MRSLQASPSARWERTASVLAEEGYAGWAISRIEQESGTQRARTFLFVFLIAEVKKLRAGG